MNPNDFGDPPALTVFVFHWNIPTIIGQIAIKFDTDIQSPREMSLCEFVLAFHLVLIFKYSVKYLTMHKMDWHKGLYRCS